MRIGRNFTAGLINSLWSALVGFVVVPYYIEYLGIEAYGLVGFFITLQALFQLLDFGLAPTINREVARCTNIDDMPYARNLLHSLALIYWCTAVCIIIVVYFASPYIADYWLQANNLPRESIIQAISLMGMIIACRWPAGVYVGALMGAQRLTISSSINIVIITIGNFGAIGILAYISPTIQAFFLWQASIGIIYAFSMRHASWKILKRNSFTHFEFETIKNIWRFSVSMSGVTLTAVVLLQADKVMLSSMLSLDDFGRYTVATVVSSGLYILLTPLFNTIYPHMTLLVSHGNTEQLSKFYKDGTRLFLAFLCPITALVVIFSREILFIWTGDQALSIQVAPIVSVMIVGTAINGIMHFSYALQLANGNPDLAFRINLVLIVIMLPSLYFFTVRYGAIGGAIAWLIINFSYFIIGTTMTHRRFLKGIGIGWALNDIGIPMIITFIIIGFGGNLIQMAGFSIWSKGVFGLLLFVLATASIILISPNLRSITAKTFFHHVDTLLAFRKIQE